MPLIIQVIAVLVALVVVIPVASCIYEQLQEKGYISIKRTGLATVGWVFVCAFLAWGVLRIVPTCDELSNAKDSASLDLQSSYGSMKCLANKDGSFR